MSPRKQIEEQLNELPPAPSPRFYRRLARAPWTPAGRARSRLFGGAAAALLLAVVLIAVTPQGRAWARELLHFFVRAESDTQPITPPGADVAWNFDLSLDEARAQADFDVVAPAWLPETLSFDGAAYDAGYDIVRLSWSNPDSNGLVLTEQPLSGPVDCQICEIVGASAGIEAVQVGDVPGEYVVGVWQANDSGEWNWVSNPWLQRVRWQADGVAYELLYVGAPESMTRADLLVIAASVGRAEAVQPAVLWGLTLAEAQERAGYLVTIPASTPPGYALNYVVYDTQTGAVIQHYAFSPYQAGEFFLLVQSPALSADVIGNSATVEMLEIGGIPVEYVNGTWLAAAGSVSEQWIAGQPVNTFCWQSEGFYYTLQFWVDDTFSPAFLTRDDMVAMVEVVMGVRDAFPERLNYSNLTSIEQARQVADFDILAPEVLPDGYIFGYASYDPGQRMVLIYTPADASSASSNAFLVIFESVTSPGAEFSWADYPAEAIETVTIDGTTGTFVRGAVVDDVYDPDFGASLAWEANGLLINIQLRDPGALSPDLLRDLLVQIAESMR